RRQTPHPSESASTSGDALSRKGRGHNDTQPIATSALAPSPQLTTYTSGSKLELGFLKALRKAPDIGTL
ncbi:hypothetical protein FXB41_17620, partial [Bradyrhizobium canariense]|nr:hypothetical protein [Bradyrhizobium canariense]